jgi:hypothetical protein
MKKYLLVLFVASLLGGCLDEADQRQREATAKMTAEADKQIGMPGITNFRERRMMKTLYELRDTELTTYTYLVAWDNNLTLLCSSMGFGLPYATQFTNPERYSHEGGTLPQAEPNGLFMPSSAEATWVMCVNGTDKKVQPVYVEQRVIVSPFPLK